MFATSAALGMSQCCVHTLRLRSDVLDLIHALLECSCFSHVYAIQQGTARLWSYYVARIAVHVPL
jgi:hypothetical protein